MYFWSGETRNRPWFQNPDRLMSLPGVSCLLHGGDPWVGSTRRPRNSDYGIATLFKTWYQGVVNDPRCQHRPMTVLLAAKRAIFMNIFHSIKRVMAEWNRKYARRYPISARVWNSMNCQIIVVICVVSSGISVMHNVICDLYNSVF